VAPAVLEPERVAFVNASTGVARSSFSEHGPDAAEVGTAFPRTRHCKESLGNSGI